MPELLWIDADASPEQMLELLGEPGADLPLDEQTGRADRFLARLAGLGLRSRGEPPDREFIADSAARLAASWVGVLRFRDGLLDWLRDSFVADEWLQSCERRTALQFLADWYADSPGLRLQELELDRNDELMRHRGETEGFLLEEQIPDGVPPSHWWWRLPDRG
jgi:hypothetical protein